MLCKVPDHVDLMLSLELTFKILKFSRKNNIESALGDMKDLEASSLCSSKLYVKIIQFYQSPHTLKHRGRRAQNLRDL